MLLLSRIWRIIVRTPAWLRLLLGGGDPEIVLVRHADYPVGGTEFNRRADQLSHVLDDIGLSHIIVSDEVRTQQAAAPTARAEDLTPQVIPLTPDNVTNTVAAARSHHSTVLIVGHSDTVPDMIRELTGQRVSGIAPDDFDHLFIVHRRRLQHLHYGARTPSPTAPEPGPGGR